MASQKADKGIEMVAKAETEQKPVKKVNTFAKAQNEPLPECLRSPCLYQVPQIRGVSIKLDEQNKAIYEGNNSL